MSNVNTPDGLAHSMAESLMRENKALRAEVARLKEENENLCTVMIAAAEEIHEFWDAHCDEEGYGPANLMHRLERGIPAEYGYKAGDFDRLMKERDDLTQQLAAAQEYAERLTVALQGIMEYSETESHPCGPKEYTHHGRMAQAALALPKPWEKA